VAEEFAFEQVFRDGSRVDGDEGLRVARAVFVQRAGDELLAGARLAGDQHAHWRLRETADAAKEQLHGGRVAEQVTTGERFIGRRRGGRHALRGPAHEGEQFVDVEGLGDVFEGAALQRLHGGAEIGERRHHDDR